MLDREEWNRQQHHWQRFETWEREHLQSTVIDFPTALAWMAEAWELAERLNARWNSTESAKEHWSHLVEIERRLACGMAGA